MGQWQPPPSALRCRFRCWMVPTSCQVRQARPTRQPPDRGRYNAAPSLSIARDEGFCLAQCLTLLSLPSVRLAQCLTCWQYMHNGGLRSAHGAHARRTPAAFKCCETCTAAREHRYSTYYVVVDAESRLCLPACLPYQALHFLLHGKSPPSLAIATHRSIREFASTFS